MKLFPNAHATHPQWRMAAALVFAQLQAQMAQLTGLLEVQKKSEAPKLSGPAQELSTAAMARAMKTQKGEMR